MLSREIGVSTIHRTASCMTRPSFTSAHTSGHGCLVLIAVIVIVVVIVMVMVLACPLRDRGIISLLSA